MKHPITMNLRIAEVRSRSVKGKTCSVNVASLVDHKAKLNKIVYTQSVKKLNSNNEFPLKVSFNGDLFSTPCIQTGSRDVLSLSDADSCGGCSGSQPRTWPTCVLFSVACTVSAINLCQALLK
jgi:hypothetical protein